MIVIADTQERRAAVAGRSLARVGEDPAIVEHVKRTNENIVTTENEISKWELKTQDSIHDRVTSGSFGEACKKGVPVSDCMTPSENKVNDWIKNSWVPFVKRWNNFISYYRDGWAYPEAEISKYDVELNTLRNEFSTLSSTTLPALKPTMSDANKSWDPVGGIKTGNPLGEGVGSLFGTLERLVWIGGILVIGYFGFVYILPAFLGAGATARSARRSYQEA